MKIRHKDPAPPTLEAPDCLSADDVSEVKRCGSEMCVRLGLYRPMTAATKVIEVCPAASKILTYGQRDSVALIAFGKSESVGTADILGGNITAA